MDEPREELTKDLDEFRAAVSTLGKKLAEVKSLADDLTSKLNIMRVRYCEEYRESLKGPAVYPDSFRKRTVQKGDEIQELC